MATEMRIEQFRKMTEADPDNELGHFSLGKALLDAGQASEAVAPLRRAIQLNPNITKAYQVLGTALVQTNQKAAAIEQLTAGVTLADARGEFQPRNDMMHMLRELGAPLPELQKSVATGPVSADQVQCVRCGRAGRKLPSPPFSNAQGKEIQQKVCAVCWREWIAMGTKVINELRLPLHDPEAQKLFDQHMIEFLNLR